MLIQLVGLNHKTAPVELRERLHIPEEIIPGALQVLHQRVQEGLIFSTCNRFEILAQAENAEASEVLVHFICEQKKIARENFEPYLYRHMGPGAVRHVFRVTSSLDSMVIGEPQILGQMKSFFQ